ncbi:hypothetical protein SNE40_006976 [Patella caerulea]|uniref:Uncharacterized protein n=1 Tax=Patella caerulea TaxID=87958 RepID=A0AAN8Q1N8_PATCE
MPKIIPFSRGMMLLQMSIQSSQSGKNSNEKPTEMFKPTDTDTNEKPTEMFKPTATDTNYELSNTIVDKGGEINDLGEISISEIQEIEIEEDQPNIDILNHEFIQNIVADNYVKSDMDISKICTETDMDELDMDDSVRDPDWVQHSSTDDDDDDSDTLLDRPPVINLQVPGEKRPKQKGIEWESTKNKRLRMEGKKYQGLKKVDGHYKFCNERKERKYL